MQTVEFIESYTKVGNDYQWHDNHGELVRCKTCMHLRKADNWCSVICNYIENGNWFCADGERKEE